MRPGTPPVTRPSVPLGVREVRKKYETGDRKKEKQKSKKSKS